LADAFAPKTKLTNQSGDIGELVDREMTNAAKAIDAATERLNKLMNKPRDQYSTYELKIHDSILEAAIAVTNAIAQLIKAATASQQEIVQQGRGTSMSKTQFYKKNNRWTEGLISAAKAVARSTNMLIETADGVISGRNSPEQLIVASNDVAASTAQLVAASRVKASFASKTQERLEESSKAVTNACRSLVRQVQSIIEGRKDGEEDVDYSKLSGHDFKVRQMEQQVEILQLENALSSARHRLGEMRKISYQEED
ncbi:SLA2 Src like adaptor 2, partial [Hortaea werneckii]